MLVGCNLIPQFQFVGVLVYLIELNFKVLAKVLTLYPLQIDGIKFDDGGIGLILI